MPKVPSKKVRYGNRGMWLENAIIHTNKQYRAKQLARIDKVPTDISYNTRTNKAYYKSKGTVDFKGLDKEGRFIAFDTKNTNGTSLPLSNIKQHQVDYLQEIKAMNGSAFFLIYFSKYKELYRLDIATYLSAIKVLDRKSIPYSFFDEFEPIRSKNGILFDYLGVG
ncbi:Holliday junction resolvase RecU [Staphylococcus hominis]|uniref:Holliday junction resolvase RecU n=1 Tax=Staphylococcus hominis TaxID=1290 RepID=UPI001F5AB523|nr:Holliday junction resolvase RecU [Staphylococcus hominis]MCI2896241.1 Holliday junction resolvase RecU [Staphylococcus hominis]MDS3901063.1 Holliday junction resolvase RecU [Staphylococcus hominis]